MATPVRVGMIGVGGIARRHIDQLLQIEDVHVVALTDPSEAQKQKTREQFPALAAVREAEDHRALLRLPGVDAVVISTPHTLHLPQTLDALDAGKHILLEKPMVSRLEDAHMLLVRLERAPGQVVAVAYQRHTQPAFIHMRNVITSGALGAVTYVAGLQCEAWKQKNVGTWRTDPALSGGGQLNDAASHLQDILLWITGLRAAEVSAFIDNCGTPVDINSAVNVRFTNGAQGTLSVVGAAQNWTEELTVWCEEGSFFYRGRTLEFCGRDGKRQPVPEADLPPGSNICRNFIDAVRGEAEVAAPPICGLRTIELTEAAWKSAAQNGLPVKIH